MDRGYEGEKDKTIKWEGEKEKPCNEAGEPVAGMAQASPLDWSLGTPLDANFSNRLSRLLGAGTADGWFYWMEFTMHKVLQQGGLRKGRWGPVHWENAHGGGTSSKASPRRHLSHVDY
ncbi:hypothetical protein TWF569_007847 [Orbilia oligospora]|uniref:Uncharacterized protein n=1 Tax=Orbilia oligospora TaxID=2813651 RepID=A0A7C8NG11_ORBOL|nr:hypothetical protein TWF706_005021 [Orbilia oligospora]KAF3107111.1 hypothetical protein TWF102_000945 [Orbilia oligospora]KAF3108469.1 hypothetical protein TWF103_005549 [Orbilia oligospora]KAF3141624.1 hypothetical protein TWF569_007847 [Orbilia oligospora]KAF3142934.1 hypothetical protein TWF594_005325 [Orbilia oligospora]